MSFENCLLSSDNLHIDYMSHLLAPLQKQQLSKDCNAPPVDGETAVRTQLIGFKYVFRCQLQYRFTKSGNVPGAEHWEMKLEEKPEG